MEYGYFSDGGKAYVVTTFDDWEVARVIPTCALTGEAAGKAAVRYIKKAVFA